MPEDMQLRLERLSIDSIRCYILHKHALYRTFYTIRPTCRYMSRDPSISWSAVSARLLAKGGCRSTPAAPFVFAQEISAFASARALSNADISSCAFAVADNAQRFTAIELGCPWRRQARDESGVHLFRVSVRISSHYLGDVVFQYNTTVRKSTAQCEAMLQSGFIFQVCLDIGAALYRVFFRA